MQNLVNLGSIKSLGSPSKKNTFNIPISANNSISLNGSNQSGQITHYTALSGLTDFTVEYWIYNSGANANKAFFEFGSAATEFFRDNFDGSGTNTCNAGNGYAGAEGFFGTIQANAKVRDSNTWTHEAWVQTSSSKSLALFKNGVSVAADFSSNGTGAQNSSIAAKLTIGTNDAAASFSNVRVGCIRVWNNIRTVGQILANYQFYLDPNQETGLILNCNLTEGTGTTSANTAVSGNDMNFTNTPTWAVGPTVTVKPY